MYHCIQAQRAFTANEAISNRIFCGEFRLRFVHPLNPLQLCSRLSCQWWFSFDLELSKVDARAYSRVLKVARTIADLAGSDVRGLDVLAEWPVGCYHKAHHHGGGAVLVILRSEGYSLMWPNEWGPRPYANGYGEKVVRVDWTTGSAFSPPTGWFHQHFNTGREPALQLALRCGSQNHPLGIRVAAMRAGVYTSVKDGGTLIEYEDEDPEIRRRYQAEIKATGIAFAMP
jgi:hypothetical protein